MAFYLLLSILGPVVELLLLISFGPWAFRKLTEFVKSQVDAAFKKPVLVYYHRREVWDIDQDTYTDPPDAPSVGLDFIALDPENNPGCLVSYGDINDRNSMMPHTRGTPMIGCRAPQWQDYFEFIIQGPTLR